MNIEFTEEAERDLKKLNNQVAQRVVSKILWFARNFERQIMEALTGNLKGLFKLRVGDWRVIYAVDHKEQVLTIHFVGHRGNVYKIVRRKDIYR